MTPTLNVLGFVAEADYAKFLQVVADPQDFPPTHAAFNARYQQVLGMAKATGLPVVELTIDPQELAAWCATQGMPVNRLARQAFNAWKHTHGAKK